MLDGLNDEQNALLNKLAYMNLSNYQGLSIDKALGLLRTDDALKLRDAINQVPGLGSFVITDSVNNNDSGSRSGFCAIAFRDPSTGETGMSFRGTEGMNDLLNNPTDMVDNTMTAIMGISPQSEEAIRFFEKNQANNGSNYLYGHSKGGELASEVYAEYYRRINAVHLINPQPINLSKLSLEQRIAFLNGKFNVVVVAGDLVWMLGGAPYPVRFSSIKDGHKPDDFWGPHDIDAINFSNGAVVETNNPYEDHLGQGIAGSIARMVISVVQSSTSMPSYVIRTGIGVYDLTVNNLPILATRFADLCMSSLNKYNGLTDEMLERMMAFYHRIQHRNTDFGMQDISTSASLINIGDGVKASVSRINDLVPKMMKLGGKTARIGDELEKCGKNIDWNIHYSTALDNKLAQAVGNIYTSSSLLLEISEYLSTAARGYEENEKGIVSLLSS